MSNVFGNVEIISSNLGNHSDKTTSSSKVAKLFESDDYKECYKQIFGMDYPHDNNNY